MLLPSHISRSFKSNFMMMKFLLTAVILVTVITASLNPKSPMREGRRPWPASPGGLKRPCRHRTYLSASLWGETALSPHSLASGHLCPASCLPHCTAPSGAAARALPARQPHCYGEWRVPRGARGPLASRGVCASCPSVPRSHPGNDSNGVALILPVMHVAV